MKPIATTKMSSKGQVVIPEGIRQQLGLDPGTQFVVVGQKDVIILDSAEKPPDSLGVTTEPIFAYLYPRTGYQYKQYLIIG